MLKQLIIVIIFSFVFISCKRGDDALRWNVDAAIPLIHGELNVSNIIADSLITSNGDSSLLLKYEGPLVNLDLDEILLLPDTVITDTFQAPFPSPINVSPGQVFINDPQEESFDLKGASLKSVNVLSGKIVYEVSSSVKGIVEYTYQIPSAIDQFGQPFSKIITIPAASGNPNIVSGSFKLDGYSIDLTGQSGNEFNTILTNVNCKVSNSNSTGVSISSSDKIIISNEIQDVQLLSAEGYFGQHEFSSGQSSADFNGFDNWIDGLLAFEEINVGIRIENGVGIDLIARVNDLTAVKNSQAIDLQHAFIGKSISMTRAVNYGDSISPSVYNVNLSNQNSNIDDFIGLLPNEINYDIELDINPLGNVSGYNDFFYRYAPIGIYLDAELPLSLTASNLIFQDTLLIEFNDNSMVNNAVIQLDLENGFPIDAEVSIGIMDMNDKVIDYLFSPETVPSGILGVDDRVADRSLSSHQISLSSKNLERLRDNGKIVLTIQLNTSGQQQVMLYDYYSLGYDMKSNLNVTISTK